MAYGDDFSDAFAVPDFWKSSKWLDEALPTPSSQFFNLKLADLEHPAFFVTQTHVVDERGFFKLPDVTDSSDEFTGKTTISEPEAPDAASSINDFDDSLSVHDFWLNPVDLRPEAPRCETWDSFDGATPREQRPLFLTEAGPAAVDALIKAQGLSLGIQAGGGNVVNLRLFCSSLLSLSLGRESILYSWRPDLQAFKPTLPSIRVSGCSAAVLRGIQAKCLQCGNIFRRLQTFTRASYSIEPTPCRVALASAVDRVLLVLQSSVGHDERQSGSILQLQATVKKLSSILVQFDRLVSSLRPRDTDEGVLNVVFEHARSADYGEDYLREALREVLQSVSLPWLRFFEEWIGTSAEEGVILTKDDTGRRKGFVRVDAEVYVDDFGLEAEETDFRLATETLPTFLPSDVAQSMFETGKNLRFIRSNHPEHPLAAQELITASQPPKARWLFDWEAILELERRARRYESDLINELQKYRSGMKLERSFAATDMREAEGFTLQFYGAAQSQMEEIILASMDQLSQPIAQRTYEDRLTEVIRNHLIGRSAPTDRGGTDFTPHWSLLPVLSFGSIVTAQARIVNRESLRLLFAAHDLRKHLKLQRDFHLLGNGMLCSRLSHALFDPDLETAERQAGVAHQGGVMGLRLSGRDTWPPASSELRLALMGVLTETYYADSESLSPGYQAGRHESESLPGDLSFAVRDLNVEEVDRVLDPDALEALDFLRLSYKTPPALTSIITPAILMQYDRIFQLLLRVLRMLYTVNQLFRDVAGKTSGWEDPDNAALRFSIEANHFVASISSYFFDTGIATAWQVFEGRLEKLEKDLNAPGLDGVSDTIPGPDRLRELHVKTLDQIMLALLLRKRQQPVLQLLEETFSVILQFAKQARLRARGNVESQSDTTELYKTFRRKADLFVTVCRGLMEKGNYGAKRRDVESDEKEGPQEENPMAQLLLKLDMFDYYAQRR